MRKVFKSVAVACTLAAWGQPELPRLADDLCSLRFEKGKLVVSDASGADVMSIGKVPFGWSKPVAVPTGAEVTCDGRMKIEFTLQNVGTNAFPFGARAYLTGHGFAVDYAARIPAAFKSGGQMVQIVRLNGTERGEQVTNCGYWKRCKPAEADGYFDPGVPFEVASMKLKPYRAKSGQVFWCRNTGWHGRATECPNFPRKAGKDGVFRGRVEFVTGVDSENAELAAAQCDGRPFVMTLSTERPFNIFEGGAPSFRLKADSLAGGARTLRTTVRDFDGKIVLERSEQVLFRVGESRTWAYALPTVPAGARGIWFVESSIADGAKEDCFARTSLAVLPPHTFRCRARSVAAMSAYPKGEAAERLMARLGVSILRYGDNRHFSSAYGITAYLARQAPGELFDPANPRHRKILDDEIVGKIKAYGSPYFEFGNEVGWHKTAEEQERLVKCYASWLKAIRARLAEENLSDKVKIITFGLQPDYSAHMIDLMKQAGVFELVDGLTLHPGRGFYTADTTQGGWVYRGIIHRARRRFDEIGYSAKEIHMTECYAATHPNDAWKDSQRQAAENTLLSLAIAGMEPRVKSMMFYKLHQGTSQDPHGYPQAHPSGVTTVNPEYDFGLLMRDDSPKPSLLAYAATCEHLDGASFLGERGAGADRSDTLRGFAYSTPRGNMAVLFDRAEGGNLYKQWERQLPKEIAKKARSGLFRHKEPWVRHWRTSKHYSFALAPGAKPEVYDVIGRRRDVRVEGGKLRLDLDGEPMFVYGLDLAAVFPATGSRQAPYEAISERDIDYAAEEKSGSLND